MSFLLGRNSSNNKLSVLNIDDDGKLKIDETGKLTDIFNKVNSLNDYIYKSLTNDLKYLRSQGYCYISHHSRSVSGSTSPVGLIQIWNNNSNYKVYVYNVFFDLSSSDSDNGYTQFSIYKCNARATSGGYPPTNNLKLYGPNKPSGIDIISNPAGSGLTFSTSDRLQVIASRFAPTQNQDFIRENDFQEEMIEVPFGYGIIFAANAGNAYQSLYHSATVRFLILPVSSYPNYPKV